MWSKTVAIAALVGDTAMRGTAAFAGRGRTRGIDVMQCVREAGAGALGIVAIVNGLVGAIIAFVGAVQLQRFGAGVYVADLVGIAVARELAALITAIVMAGRTGGAYAAHLATMQGNEEIDALKAFGIPVFDFLVLPRIAALVAMMPLLYLYGCAVGFFGGFVVSVATLDLTSVSFRGGTPECCRRQAVRNRPGQERRLRRPCRTGGLLYRVASRTQRRGCGQGRDGSGRGRNFGVIALDAVFAVCTNALGI